MLRLNSWSISVIRSLISASRARVASSWSTPARRKSSSILSSSRAAGRVEPGRVERRRTRRRAPRSRRSSVTSLSTSISASSLAVAHARGRGARCEQRARRSRRRCSAPASPRPTGAARPPASAGGVLAQPVHQLARAWPARSASGAHPGQGLVGGGQLQRGGRRHVPTLGASDPAETVDIPLTHDPHPDAAAARGVRRRRRHASDRHRSNQTPARADAECPVVSLRPSPQRSCSRTPGAGHRHGRPLGRRLGPARPADQGLHGSRGHLPGAAPPRLSWSGTPWRVAASVPGPPDSRLSRAATPPGEVGALGLVVGAPRSRRRTPPGPRRCGRAGGAGRRGSRARRGTSLQVAAGRPRPARPPGRRARRRRPPG